MQSSLTYPFDPGTTGILASGPRFKTRALLWAMLLFTMVLGFFFASVFGGGWLGLRGNWYYVVPILMPFLASCGYWALVRRIEQRDVWELHVNAWTPLEIATGFVFGGVFIAGMWFLLWRLGLYTTHRGIWTGWFSDLVFDSYISAVLEELAFRAVLFRIFSRLWGVRVGLIASAIIFGLAHLTHGSWLGVLGIVVNAGVTMALLYAITGRLWMSIGMHLGYDFVETSVLGVGSDHGYLVSKPAAGAAWLTGGSFGPDASIPAIVLGAAVSVVLWGVAQRMCVARVVSEEAA